MSKYEDKLSKQIEDLCDQLRDKDELYDKHLELLAEIRSCSRRTLLRLKSCEDIVESLLSICLNDNDASELLCNLFEHLTVCISEVDTIQTDTDEELDETHKDFSE